MAAAIQEAKFLQEILRDMRVEAQMHTPTKIWEDNQGCIALAHNQVGGRSKHNDIRYHFVRQAVEENCVRIEYKSTKLMAADFLTKATATKSFLNCRKMVMGA